ncbi:MAG: hypothetical protein CMF22_10185 [Idiomarinaceae bacterium]|nr:hypothetical protein [Idiomarinaceae bacterium]MBG23810.1 hypothetical protein [Idiomarinaceae bacterium]|tara:strand:- start:38790 stop:39017 length:228 start_codon:yes stop_codon:yes gene_type:complete
MNHQQQEFTRQLQKLNRMYLDEMEHVLLTLYHLHNNDVLTLDDIQDIGERFNLDIELKYTNIIETLPVDTDEEDD